MCIRLDHHQWLHYVLLISIVMGVELDQVICVDHLFELLTNGEEVLLVGGLCPEGNLVNVFSIAVNNTVDFIFVVLKHLTNQSETDVEPHLVDVDITLVVITLVELSTLCILDVFPLWSDILSEQVVVGLVW